MADDEKRLEQEQEGEKAKESNAAHVTKQRNDAFIATGSQLLDDDTERVRRDLLDTTIGHPGGKEERGKDGTEGECAEKAQGGNQAVGRDLKKVPVKEVGLSLPLFSSLPSQLSGSLSSSLPYTEHSYVSPAFYEGS